MDRVLLAAGAECVTGVLYLDRQEMGRYVQGAFVPTAEGHMRAQALMAAQAAKQASGHPGKPRGRRKAQPVAEVQPVAAAPVEVDLGGLDDALSGLGDDSDDGDLDGQDEGDEDGDGL